MATLQEDINIISEAVYGKEMRPAIIDALSQSWDQVKAMMTDVDALNARVDALPDIEPDNPDIPDVPVQPTNGCTIAGSSAILKSGLTTPLVAIGDAAMF